MRRALLPLLLQPLAALGSMVSTAVMAADATPMPIAAFFNRPALEQAELSPSGRWLGALAPHAGGRNSLVVIDLDGKDKPRVVVRYDDIDIDGFRWVGDERLIFGLRDWNEASGQRRRGGGLRGINRDGSDQPSFVAGGLGVVGVPRNGGADVIGIRARHDLTGEFKTLIAERVNTVTGSSESLSRGQPDQVSNILFDADGIPRAMVSDRAGRARMWWRGPGQPGWRQLADFDALAPDWWPSQVTSDGELYVVRPTGAAAEYELFRFDFHNDAPEPRALVSTPGFDFNGSIVSESRGGRALGVRTTTDAETTVWFDPQLKALQQEIDARLPGRVNRLDCRRCGTADMTVLVFSYSDREPGEYWVWRQSPVLGGANWQRVARTRDAIPSARMGRLDLHRIKARDGRDLPVWVTQPAGTAPAGGAGSKRPAVVMVHGGPWVRGAIWEWNAWTQFLASRGYVVIEPEFRGSTGYGTQHLKAGFRQWGQAMQDDVADATLWVAQHAGVDPDRICIAGASYGGYSTLMGLARHPDLYKCGVAWAAVTEPRLMFKWSAGGDIGEDWREYGLPVMLGDPVTDAAMLESVSPVVQAARIKAPLLLAFGSEDRRVPLAHGKLMRDALTDAGRPPGWVVYEGEGHYWQKTETSIDFARRMEQFLAQHLR